MGGFSQTGLHPAMAQDQPSRSSDPGTRGDDYLIGAGDVLEILVWREPDLSRTVIVRPDGKISLPLVDDVQASQGTLLQLKKRLTETLSGFVEKPSVYVMLQENRSKKVYVVGMVTTPGEYVLEKDTTVLQAIAMAGGFTEWAKKDDIVIVRKRPQGQVRIAFDFDRVVAGKDIQQNILLHPDDVIIVP
jgi:polysaccharide export outer membrane protein